MTEHERRSSGKRSGILLVDKPPGITSHGVVSRVRKAAGTRKVGHAGTLDPMATGLLVLGLNSSTRLLTFLVGLDKEYWATIRLGQSTSTDDAEGDVITAAEPSALADVTIDQVQNGLAALTGELEQVPSAVSAIKVDGKRAYAMVRAGEAVQLAPRRVTVWALELISTRRGDLLDVDIRIECSSGTYVRAIARDLGAALGVGGHLTALRRTRIGPFSVADAQTLDELDVEARLLEPAEAAGRLFPRVELDEQQAIDLSHGKRVTISLADGGPIAAVAPSGRLVGLVQCRDRTARVLVNFAQDAAVDGS